VSLNKILIKGDRKMDFEKIRKNNTVTRDVAIKMLGWETKPKTQKVEKKAKRKSKNTLSAWLTYREEEK